MLNAGYVVIALSPTYQMAIRTLIQTIDEELPAFGFIEAPRPIAEPLGVNVSPLPTRPLTELPTV